MCQIPLSFLRSSTLMLYQWKIADWAERKLTQVYLLKNGGKLILRQCCAWQQDSFDYASIEDLTSMEWAKSLMMNSCDALLIKQINKKFKDLSLFKQGGVTYIKLALDEMFTISNTVVTTLQGFFENFAKMALPKSLMWMSILPRSSL
jgi:hypothetical protein